MRAAAMGSRPAASDPARIGAIGNACWYNDVGTGVSAMGFPSRILADRDHWVEVARVDLGRVLGLAGVAAYNWWVVVPFVPGLLPSPNGFFSDLEATGSRDATVMQHADLAAGLLMVAAFLLRGSSGRRGARAEWKWMVAFAAAGAVGGKYSYACAEGLSATCRRLEWHLQLPLHHYIHVVSGIAEFAFLTTAVALAVRRTRGETTREARIFRYLLRGLIIGYPLLGLAYLTDRLGAFVEPVFFVIFSVMVVVELFEPTVRLAPHDTVDDRMAIDHAGSATVRSPDGRSSPGGHR